MGEGASASPSPSSTPGSPQARSRKPTGDVKGQCTPAAGTYGTCFAQGSRLQSCCSLGVPHATQSCPVDGGASLHQAAFLSVTTLSFSRESSLPAQVPGLIARLAHQPYSPGLGVSSRVAGRQSNYATNQPTKHCCPPNKDCETLSAYAWNPTTTMGLSASGLGDSEYTTYSKDVQ